MEDEQPQRPVGMCVWRIRYWTGVGDDRVHWTMVFLAQNLLDLAQQIDEYDCTITPESVEWIAGEDCDGTGLDTVADLQLPASLRARQ